MKIQLSIISYTRTRDETRAGPLEHFLAHLVAQGFRLIVQANDREYDRWLAATAPVPREGAAPPDTAQGMSAGRSPEMDQRLQSFLDGQVEEFSCWCLSTAREGLLSGVEFHFALSVDEGMLYTAISDRYFTHRDHGDHGDHDQHTAEEATTRYVWWVGLLREVYERWLPLYSFEYGEGAHDAYTTREQALALEPQQLYPIAFFGPEIVERFGGLAYVLAAPVWRSEVLSDGGVLLIVSPYLGASEAELRAIAAYLHLPV